MGTNNLIKGIFILCLVSVVVVSLIATLGGLFIYLPIDEVGFDPEGKREINYGKRIYGWLLIAIHVVIIYFLIKKGLKK